MTKWVRMMNGDTVCPLPDVKRKRLYVKTRPCDKFEDEISEVVAVVAAALNVAYRQVHLCETPDGATCVLSALKTLHVIPRQEAAASCVPILDIANGLLDLVKPGKPFYFEGHTEDDRLYIRVEGMVWGGKSNLVVDISPTWTDPISWIAERPPLGPTRILGLSSKIAEITEDCFRSLPVSRTFGGDGQPFVLGVRLDCV